MFFSLNAVFEQKKEKEQLAPSLIPVKQPCSQVGTKVSAWQLTRLVLHSIILHQT